MNTGISSERGSVPLALDGLFPLLDLPGTPEPHPLGAPRALHAPSSDPPTPHAQGQQSSSSLRCLSQLHGLPLLSPLPTLMALCLAKGLVLPTQHSGAPWGGGPWINTASSQEGVICSSWKSRALERQRRECGQTRHSMAGLTALQPSASAAKHPPKELQGVWEVRDSLSQPHLCSALGMSHFQSPLVYPTCAFALLVTQTAPVRP